MVAPRRGLVLLLFLVALLATGCGGRRLCLWLVEHDPCVEWVWEAPMQWGHSMFGSGFCWGWVNAAEVAPDGQIIVLTNYGGAWAWLERCHAFRLDPKTGRRLGHVTGPFDTLDSWYLDGHKVYVRGTVDGEKTWCQLDLDTGRMALASPPNRGDPRPARGGPYSGGLPWTLFFRELTIRNKVPEAHVHPVGGAAIVIQEDEIRYAPLALADRDDQRLLCRLPRIYGSDCRVLIHDDRRLVFATGSYIICLDTQRLPAAKPSGSTPKGKEKPRGHDGHDGEAGPG